MEERKLTDTVWAFLDRAGTLYGQWHEEVFRQEMHGNCLEVGMQSPIEDLFWIACYVLCATYYEEWNPDCSQSARDGSPLPKGVYVSPQQKVGPYRVDFLLSREPYLESQRTASVVVELDGHDFHDKDKKQRAYEKARDRYLVKQGFKVLHFTGSEVVADPFKVAHEALALLNAVSTPQYNPLDPLDQGT